jgi:hypothetical protein
MVAERRLIRAAEAEVIRTTLQRAAVCPVNEDAVRSIPSLAVVARCECGCASVDFGKGPSDQHSRPVGHGVGTTPRGGRDGVIVWGREEAITGLEIYDLGAGQDDLVLPVPASIAPF